MLTEIKCSDKPIESDLFRKLPKIKPLIKLTCNPVKNNWIIKEFKK